jgi:hypothetical protein
MEELELTAKLHLLRETLESTAAHSVELQRHVAEAMRRHA